MHKLTPFFIKYSAYVLFPALSFVLALVLTRICIIVLPLFKMIDLPSGGRRIHQKEVPKGGGIALYIAFFTVWGIFLNSPWAYFIGDFKFDLMIKILLLSLPLLLVGIIDDRFELKPIVKLIGQIAVATACWFFGIKLKAIFGFALPEFACLILTVFWMVSFINAFNLIDGLDGLAPGLGVISALCMAAVFAVTHNPNDTMAMLCFAACCGGFLVYNFHPAKIFLGDTGSMFIGFLFAVTGIVSSNKSSAITAVIVPMLAVGVPILDVCLAIWRRFTRKLISGTADSSSIAAADSEHLHHRLWRRDSGNQRRTAVKIYILAVLFAGIAVLHIMHNNLVIGITYAAMLLIAVSFVRRIANIELWNTGKAILEGMGFPRKSVIIYAIQPFADAAIIIVLYLGCRFLFINSAYNIYMPLRWYISTFFSTIPIILVLNLSGSYRRSWLHGSAPDYIFFVKSLGVGFLLMLIVDISGGIQGWRSYVAERLLFVALTALVLIGIRLFMRYLKYYLIQQFYVDKSYDINIEKILIFGTTVDCRYYIASKNRHFEAEPFAIVGLIEDDPLFRDQYVFSHKVLGAVIDIEDIYRKTPFARITITRSISDASLQILKQFCLKNSIKLYLWHTNEKVVPLEEKEGEVLECVKQNQTEQLG